MRFAALPTPLYDKRLFGWIFLTTLNKMMDFFKGLYVKTVFFAKNANSRFASSLTPADTRAVVHA